MSTFAIGDIHGCFLTLEHLFERLDFDLERDRLWLVGDLVNRGPRSLRVLRWARGLGERLGERMVVVLGNHDLHLLALAEGITRPRRKDTLDAVLEAADRAVLLGWLRKQPLLHRENHYLLVHAGLLPEWTPGEAELTARQVEARLADPAERRRLLARGRFAELEEGSRGRALAALTRMRMLTVDGRWCSHTGPPEEAPPDCLPWFELPDRRSVEVTVIAGHWAAMGLRIEPRYLGLDSGCAWGGRLTAIRLEDRQVFEERNRDL
jgi:bis(5'-nucleosyl)-tetraphosphatase (symmetrical)